MKVPFFIFLLISLSIGTLYSQRADTIYFDKEDHISNLNQFDYYRIARQEKSIVKVSDYYKTGKLRMTGAYKSLDFKEEVGPFYYYKNDKIKQIELNQPTKYPEIYSEYRKRLDFIPNLPDSLKLVVIFSNSEKISMIGFVRECCDKYSQWFYFFGEDRTIDLLTFKNGKRNGPLNVYRNKVLISSENYKNDKRDGVCQSFDYDGKLIQTEYYTDGKKTK